GRRAGGGCGGVRRGSSRGGGWGLLAARFLWGAAGPTAPPRVVVLGGASARRYWPGEDPLGQRVSLDGGKTWSTIVGVVADVRQYGLDKDPGTEMYLPFGQNPGFGFTLLVRTLGDPLALEREMRAAVRQADPQTPVS